VEVVSQFVEEPISTIDAHVQHHIGAVSIWQTLPYLWRNFFLLAQFFLCNFFPGMTFFAGATFLWRSFVDHSDINCTLEV